MMRIKLARIAAKSAIANMIAQNNAISLPTSSAAFVEMQDIWQEIVPTDNVVQTLAIIFRVASTHPSDALVEAMQWTENTRTSCKNSLAIRLAMAKQDALKQAQARTTKVILMQAVAKLSLGSANQLAPQLHGSGSGPTGEVTTTALATKVAQLHHGPRLQAEGVTATVATARLLAATQLLGSKLLHQAGKAMDMVATLPVDMVTSIRGCMALLQLPLLQD